MKIPTVAKLREMLEEKGVRPDSYCLSGGFPNEALCIERKRGGEWWVYYSERGQRTSLQKFQSEQNACECLMSMILEDVEYD